MLLTYGPGVYVKGTSSVTGTILLDEHKLFLKQEGRELTDTFIALDKVWRIKASGKGVQVFVALSQANSYAVTLNGQKREMLELIKEISSRRGFKKKFISNDWIEDNA